ncbi:MAG TPA: MBL fold metallo-hydrolase [Patescibacteria group bacterium]|nr:MBL fold metallo-hydrolase [Patescibacteria group bacterium]
MKITKYEHACLVVEEQGKLLVIDPGSYSTSLPENLTNVSAIVITHVHADHFDPTHIKNLLEQNNTAQVYCTNEVAKQLTAPNIQPVTGGDLGNAGPFHLKFFGGQHAIIHASYPTAQNVGVLVNDKLYYPGDSFTEPSASVQLLALPVSAPWLKLAEVMDYLTAVKPKRAFPTHNALLSDIGENMVENMLGGITKTYGGSLQPIPVGETIEV